MRQLLDLIRREWNILRNYEAIEIAKIYGKLTRRVTTVLLRKKILKGTLNGPFSLTYRSFAVALLEFVYHADIFLQIRLPFSVYSILSWLVLVTMELISVINGTSTTTNKSLPRQNDISLGWFSRENTYVLAVKFTGIIVITATITMLIVHMRHICMMLRIT